jgi:hypothetical protein
MGGDEARKLILARRARFVAAAFAGVAATCGGACEPDPCLSIAMDERDLDGGNDGTPQPCLTPEVFPDSGTDAQPQPCLTPPIDFDAGDGGDDAADGGDGD